jgi:hypothetical protein
VRLGAAHADEARAALLAQGRLGLGAVVRDRPLLEPDDVDPWPLQALRSVQGGDLDAAASGWGQTDPAECQL